MFENNKSTVKSFIGMFVKNFNENISKMENEITELKQISVNPSTVMNLWLTMNVLYKTALNEILKM